MKNGWITSNVLLVRIKEHNHLELTRLLKLLKSNILNDSATMAVREVKWIIEYESKKNASLKDLVQFMSSIRKNANLYRRLSNGHYNLVSTVTADLQLTKLNVEADTRNSVPLNLEKSNHLAQMMKLAVKWWRGGAHNVRITFKASQHQTETYLNWVDATYKALIIALKNVLTPKMLPTKIQRTIPFDVKNIYRWVSYLPKDDPNPIKIVIDKSGDDYVTLCIILTMKKPNTHCV